MYFIYFMDIGIRCYRSSFWLHTQAIPFLYIAPDPSPKPRRRREMPCQRKAGLQGSAMDCRNRPRRQQTKRAWAVEWSIVFPRRRRNNDGSCRFAAARKSPIFVWALRKCIVVPNAQMRLATHPDVSFGFSLILNCLAGLPGHFVTRFDIKLYFLSNVLTEMPYGVFTMAICRFVVTPVLVLGEGSGDGKAELVRCWLAKGRKGGRSEEGRHLGVFAVARPGGERFY